MINTIVGITVINVDGMIFTIIFCYSQEIASIFEFMNLRIHPSTEPLWGLSFENDSFWKKKGSHLIIINVRKSHKAALSFSFL